jgi:hypothetical protein
MSSHSVSRGQRGQTYKLQSDPILRKFCACIYIRSISQTDPSSPSSPFDESSYSFLKQRQMMFRRTLASASAALSRRSLGVFNTAGAPLVKRVQAAPSRLLSTSRPRSAQYERFGSRQTTPPPGGGRPDVLTFLRRRAGGDRALVVYGVAVGGGVVYYVVQ